VKEDFSRLRKNLQRSGDRHFLERIDDLYHRHYFFGGWIFCDLWEGHVTGNYSIIFRERIRKATKAFRNR
jgi:hypothetical protein